VWVPELKEEAEMVEKTAGAVALVSGIALGVVSAGPLTWGLGVLVAVVLIVAGVAGLTG
jgi:hypothetical protein